MEIRKATNKDIPDILVLLSELNSAVSVEKWKPFFNYYHGDGEPMFGFVLEIDKKIEGFIGTVISNRNYNGQEVKCCNIHGWIVREKHKQYSLKMMTEVLKQNMVFTCFSAMEITQMILKRLKFFYINHDYRIFRPSFSLNFSSPSINVVNNSDEIDNKNDKVLFESHSTFPSVFVTIVKQERKCLLIFKPEYYLPSLLKPVSFIIPKKFKRLLKLEYIGDTSVFNESFKENAFNIMFKSKCLGFVLSNESLENAEIKKSKKYFGQRPYMYRYDKERLGSVIPDTLYSEMFVLNHKG